MWVLLQMLLASKSWGISLARLLKILHSVGIQNSMEIPPNRPGDLMKAQLQKPALVGRIVQCL